MTKSKSSGGGHTWRFFRAGGFDQVRLDSGSDLLELERLNLKLWVALACPVDNVCFDARTLSLIDSNGDRRIRANELIAAIKWTASLLKSPDDLVGPAPRVFNLAALNDASEEGKALLAAAKRAVAALGKKENDPVTVADIEALEKVLSQKHFNGDGVITGDSTADKTLQTIIGEIIADQGGSVDRSGKPGVTAEKVEAFFTRANEYEVWFAESERAAAIRPLGAATDAAATATAAVRGKIDDYFARCAIAKFDDRATMALNGGEKSFEALSSGGPFSMQTSGIGAMPLARIQGDAPLSLVKDINPAWQEAMHTFETAAVRPLLGVKETITEADWKKVLAAFSPWLAWQDKKPSTAFDAMGIARVREIIKGGAKIAILNLIAEDKAQAATFDSLLSLEKLVRFHRDLHSLCVNFVNFKDFYARGGGAVFQAGTLYLDQRSCDLCIKVDDMNKHSVMASMAGAYLAYCECRRRGGADKMNIVAAFTNGDSDNLIVGRNGVFYDRQGNDWDATITKIIDNPISLRQAFWLPYKSLVRMIESQVAKRASAADAQSTAKLEQTAAATASADKALPAPAAPVAPPKKLDIGVVAALGVAAGALGTFIATLMGYFAGIVRLGPLAIIGAFLGVMLLISGPSLVLAYIKLRKRNIGPILDGCGWAINAKARINVPFGTALTHIASLPPGAQRDLVDPYAEKKSPWPKIVAFALCVYLAYFALDHFGFINKWTGGSIGIQHVPKAATEVKK